MEPTEPPENIVPICKGCLKERFPRKGKFTISELLGAEFVKKRFNNEHMWVKVIGITGNKIAGIVDNTPVLPGNPKYGTKVTVDPKEVEEILPFRW